MTYKEYLIASVHRFEKECHHWRMGQTLYNVLREERPDLAGRVVGTDLDPFYVDDHATYVKLFVFLQENWDA